MPFFRLNGPNENFMNNFLMKKEVMVTKHLVTCILCLAVVFEKQFEIPYSFKIFTHLLIEFFNHLDFFSHGFCYIVWNPHPLNSIAQYKKQSARIFSTKSSCYITLKHTTPYIYFRYLCYQTLLLMILTFSW